MKGNLIAISLIGTDESLRKIDFFRIIKIRIIGSFIAIDDREKSRDCLSSSNNPLVLDNRRSDNRDLTVLVLFCKRAVRLKFQEGISFKDNSILVFQFVPQSITVCAILVESIMWNISVKLFLINLGQWLMRRYCLKIFLL